MLKHVKPMAFVPISDAAKTRAFYRDTLGLELLSEDEFAMVFDLAGVMLRATFLKEVHPQPHTVLGWQITDVTQSARMLVNAGVVFERFPGLPQDEDGVWTAPGGSKIAWFKDPDGNILSLAEL